MKSFLQGLRATGAIVGLITMLTGLIYASKIFMLAFNTLKSPAAAHKLLTQWTEALGGEQLSIAIQGATCPGATFAALATLGGLTVLLIWLSTALITIGGKIISATLGDREAIKKILTDSFGSRQKPIPANPTEPLSPQPENNQP